MGDVNATTSPLTNATGAICPGAFCVIVRTIAEGSAPVRPRVVLPPARAICSITETFLAHRARNATPWCCVRSLDPAGFWQRTQLNDVNVVGYARCFTVNVADSAVFSSPFPALEATVLVAHPEGDIHGLAHAALIDRYVLRRARTQQAAIKIAAQIPIDVVILGAEERYQPRQLFLTLKQSRPHLRAIFVSNQAWIAHSPGLTALGAVLPHDIDASRLQAAVQRALSMSRMSSGVHALRRDLVDVADRLSSIPPPPADIKLVG